VITAWFIESPLSISEPSSSPHCADPILKSLVISHTGRNAIGGTRVIEGMGRKRAASLSAALAVKELYRPCVRALYCRARAPSGLRSFGWFL